MRALLLLLCGCAAKNIETQDESPFDRIEIEIPEEELEGLPEACDPETCDPDHEDSP